jgi:anionic cell wall polymer biosynthesis LytR-Cps2A-Psr (LCP) family protein
MRQACKILAFIGLISLAAACHAQSLGDVAREQRQKQAKDAHLHKVVTNEDIPESPEATSTTSVNDEPVAPASNDTHAAEQWKAKLETQRSSVASLQSQIDKLNASIHFAGPNCVANCVQYNERQIHKQDEVERLQKQLAEQKKKLEDMQESARKAGLGSSVYEP